MANCLQFSKEVSTHPGNSGTSKTRALVCELLAIKLLKEFSTRELVGLFLSSFQCSKLTRIRLVIRVLPYVPHRIDLPTRCIVL